MNAGDPKDALRRYYVRQFRKSGWRGNAGGWVYAPNGFRTLGWYAMILHLARQFNRWGRGV